MYSDKSQIAEVQQNLFCWANIGLFWVDSVHADLKLDQFQKKDGSSEKGRVQEREPVLSQPQNDTQLLMVARGWEKQ